MRPTTIRNRNIVTPAFCVFAAACSTDAAELALAPPSLNEDAGSRTDSGAATAADASAATEVDTGIAIGPQGCEQGWVDVAQIDAEGSAVTGTSFAAQPSGFALIWTERTGDFISEKKTLLAFFDAAGAIRGEPIEVDPRSRVIADDNGGFLRGGEDGMERYDLAGVSLDRSNNQFVPLKMIGGRLWGLNLDNYVSTAVGRELANLVPFAVGVAGSYRTIGFGPDRFVVADELQSFDQPLVLRVFALDLRGSIEIQNVSLPAETINGEAHLGHALAAAEWNEREARFELLVGMRLGPTRQFGARLMHLDERGLSDGPPLYPEPESVAYENLSGAIAIGENGSLALAYRSPYSASTLLLDLVRGENVEHFLLESGASYPTRALIEPIGQRFAVVYGTGASSTSVFERVLQMRCDVPQ